MEAADVALLYEVGLTMGRQQQRQAGQIFNESQGVFNTAQGQTGNLYDTLLPEYQQEATNPQGFGTALPEMKTNAEQSVGGSTSGAIGEGELLASRRRNLGGFEPALDESARVGDQALAGADVNIDIANQLLKEQQKQEGLSGQQGLYGTSNADMLSALGLGTNAVNAATDAGRSGWFQNFIGLINALKPTGSAGGGQPASVGIGG